MGEYTGLDGVYETDDDGVVTRFRPQVLATPAGWVRLDEAARPVVQEIDAAFRDRLSAIVTIDGAEVPGVKMRVISRTEPQTIVWSDAGDFSDWDDDEPEPDIMSAVRAVARSS